MTELDGSTIRQIAKVHVEQGAAYELRRRADDLEMRANRARLTAPSEDGPERVSVVAGVVLLEVLAQEFRDRADQIACGSTDVYRDTLTDAGLPRTTPTA